MIAIYTGKQYAKFNFYENDNLIKMVTSDVNGNIYVEQGKSGTMYHMVCLMDILYNDTFIYNGVNYIKYDKSQYEPKGIKYQTYCR